LKQEQSSAPGKNDEQKRDNSGGINKCRRNALKRMAKAALGGAGFLLFPCGKSDAGSYVAPPPPVRYYTYTTYQYNSYSSYGNYSSYNGYYSYTPKSTQSYSNYYADYSSTACDGDLEFLYSDSYYSGGAYGGEGKQDVYYTVCYPKEKKDAKPDCTTRTIYSDMYSSTAATCKYCDPVDEKQDFKYTVCYNSTQY